MCAHYSRDVENLRNLLCTGGFKASPLDITDRRFLNNASSLLGDLERGRKRWKENQKENWSCTLVCFKGKTSRVPVGECKVSFLLVGFLLNG